MILIIGYGNTLREDDGAGIRLAHKLEQVCQAQCLPTRLITSHQLLPEYALDIAEPAVTAVIFVDTRAVPPAQTGPTVEIVPLVTPQPDSPGLGHHLTPGTLLLYADQLYSQRPPAWLMTIPGVSFGHGETLSPQTQHALASADEIIKACFISIRESDE
jgi:hydrogenase maturation protease